MASDSTVCRRKRFVHELRNTPLCLDDGAWIMLSDGVGMERKVRVEKALVMLVDNGINADAKRPCAVARVFKPDANTTPATNTMADVVDYAWNPDNAAKVATLRGLPPHQCALYAMAACDGILRQIAWHEGDPCPAVLGKYVIDTISLTDFEESELDELDPALPAD